MGIGKMLGLAALGVGAVAAAPFTGGGSILAATGAAASLAGAGTIAAATGAAAVGAAAGAVLSKKEEEEEERKKRKLAKANMEVTKAKATVEEHKKHSYLIIALTALAVSMANVDGSISPEERVELDEFIGGLASSSYPKHIIETINSIVKNPPNFNEAMKYLEKVPEIEYSEIRNLLVLVMEADGEIHEKEKAFLSAFDAHLAMAS